MTCSRRPSSVGPGHAPTWRNGGRPKGNGAPSTPPLTPNHSRSALRIRRFTMTQYTASRSGTRPGLGAHRTLDVLVRLDHELGHIDETARAIVGLRAEADGTVALIDVELREDGVLIP